MPWELSIVNGTLDNRLSLGTRESVNHELAKSIPGLALEQTPTPPQDILEMMPPAVRDAMTRPKLEGNYDREGVSIQFYTSDTAQIDWINAEVRGDGDPLPPLKAICEQTGWTVIDVSENRILNPAESSAESWNRFCWWRDEAVRQMRHEP